MKHIRMMIAGAALLAGSLAFGASQDAVALTDSQMDQVTGEYVVMNFEWTGYGYVMRDMFFTSPGGDHGRQHYHGGPMNGYVATW
jgi:hypothetical protein